MKRAIILSVLGLSFLYAFWGAVQPVHADSEPEFVETECTFELVMGNPEATEIICGTVDVPEFHDKPEGKKITLAVVILKATGDQPAADPLIMAQGGPGGSTIDTYADMVLSKPEILQDRDIILFDQRGTLYSSPALTCPEVMDLTIETIDQDMEAEEANHLYEEALDKCRTRLVDEGVDLSAYNSFENAADIDWIRRALGYEQVNYYGVSYGTLLGLHLLRTQPEWLRSAVLDSVVPPDVNFIIEASGTKARSFNMLFTSCQEDPDCNRAYPNLKEEYEKLVDRLNETPIRVKVTDSETFQSYETIVDGDTVTSMFFQMLYATDLIPALPRTVYDLKEGKTDFFSRIYELILFDRSMSEGMYYSVICAEDSDFKATDADDTLAAIPDWLAAGEQEGLESILSTCQSWGTLDLNPKADEVVESDIPVLLLNGEFDPITPPENGERASQTLSRSVNLTFPGMGHGEFLSNDCPTSITLAFLNNPSQDPDSSCISEMGVPAYLTPKSMVDFPVIMQVLNIKPQGLISTVALLLFCTFLGLALIAMPIAWIINRFNKSRTPRTQPFFASLAIWLPGLASLLIGAFLVGVIALAVKLVNDNNTVIFFGLPANARPLFLLTILAALVLLVVLYAAVRSWVKGWYSIPMRIYYSLLALSGLGAIAVLGYWGALFPF